MIIKFNAWDKFEKKMILWNDMIKDKESEKLIPEILLNSGRYIPLLLSSIKDKDNVEIFEGVNLQVSEYRDLANKEDRFPAYILEVCFRRGGFYLVNKNCCEECKNGFGVTMSLSEAVCIGEIKVVGNIYEGLKIDL